MTETVSSPAVDAAPAQIIDYQPPADTQEPLSVDQAFELWQKPKDETPPDDAPAEAPEAPAQPEIPARDADQPEADPGEATKSDEPEAPAIDPPRSWTKEAKERWAALPRETQEYLAQREEERDRGLNRSQTELAEQRKAVQAERDAAVKAKSEYEGKLPALMQALHEVNNHQFADIRSQADLDKLSVEDPFRWIQFQTHQQRMHAVQDELNKAQHQKATEDRTNWATHVQTESAKFEESVPAAEKAALAKMRNEAPAFLQERGFTQNELNDLASGKSKLSIYDHRIQSLIHDGMKLAEIQKAPIRAVPKTLPPVQKPGVAQQRGAAAAQSIQSLNQRLNESGSIDDALALLRAQRTG